MSLSSIVVIPLIDNSVNSKTVPMLFFFQEWLDNLHLYDQQSTQL